MLFVRGLQLGKRMGGSGGARGAQGTNYERHNKRGVKATRQRGTWVEETGKEVAWTGVGERDRLGLMRVRPLACLPGAWQGFGSACRRCHTRRQIASPHRGTWRGRQGRQDAATGSVIQNVRVLIAAGGSRGSRADSLQG